MDTLVQQIIERYGKDKYRLMDILIDIQDARGFITEEAIKQTALSTNLSRADVLQTISFYHFFRTEPAGRFSVYLNDSVVAMMKGQRRVKKAFEKEAGCKFGQVSPDGVVGLFETSCIGMNDQEPAALINGMVFTNLTPFRVKELISDMRQGRSLEELNTGSYGDGANSSEMMKTMVRNNIYKRGIILEDPYVAGEGLTAAMKMSPDEVIHEVKESDMRGRGGAGFPTGMKWEFCRRAVGERKFIFCNADEGEPGTFKDRVILTERPGLLFEGMAIAAYSVGASEGIIYLRNEYRYLRQYLESVLSDFRKAGYLGKNILGKKGFNFDIRIQLGGGAYVCGEESALIESAEGKRGEPRDRPPFPVEKGYLQCPTVVNNVETLCAAVKIIVHSGEWYAGYGTKESAGTKVLSISGDCQNPGIYEVEWGMRIDEILDMVGAYDVQAIQIGGPSGTLIPTKEFSRSLCYSDLATGGSIIVFDSTRDIIKDVVLNFTNFFIEESCGSCSTCRAVPVVLRNKIGKILQGHGVSSDIDDIVEWAKILKVSRCGLGHSAANPILSSIRNFRHLYDSLLQHDSSFDTGFSLEAAIKDSCAAVGRVPNLKHH